MTVPLFNLKKGGLMKKSILTLFLLIAAIGAGYFIITCNNSDKTRTGAVFFGAVGNQEEKAAKTLISELESIDYAVSDSHEKINEVYEKKYGSTTLDSLNFFKYNTDIFTSCARTYVWYNYMIITIKCKEKFITLRDYYTLCL